MYDGEGYGDFIRGFHAGGHSPINPNTVFHNNVGKNDQVALKEPWVRFDVCEEGVRISQQLHYP